MKQIAVAVLCALTVFAAFTFGQRRAPAPVPPATVWFSNDAGYECPAAKRALVCPQGHLCDCQTGKPQP